VNLQAWIYALPMAGRDADAAVAQVAALREALDPMLARGAFAGWHAAALLSEDDLEEEDIDPEWIEPATGGELPAVFLNITYDRDQGSAGDAELDALIARTGLRHTLTDPPVSD
jgi:hypothetical protein